MTVVKMGPLQGRLGMAGVVCVPRNDREDDDDKNDGNSRGGGGLCFLGRLGVTISFISSSIGHLIFWLLEKMVRRVRLLASMVIQRILSKFILGNYSGG